MVAIEIGDPHGERSGAHKRIEWLVEIEPRGVLDLMRKVAPERTFARGGIVRSADAGEKQQPRVVERECRHDHQAGGLKEFISVGRGILDARRLAVFVNNAANPAVRAQFEVLPVLQDGHQRIRGLRFRADHTAEAFTVSAVSAARAGDAVGILVGRAEVSGGLRIRMQSQFLRPRFIARRKIRASERRQRILVLTRTFERISAFDDFAARLPALPLMPIICSARQ